MSQLQNKTAHVMVPGQVKKKTLQTKKSIVIYDINHTRKSVQLLFRTVSVWLNTVCCTRLPTYLPISCKKDQWRKDNLKYCVNFLKQTTWWFSTVSVNQSSTSDSLHLHLWFTSFAVHDQMDNIMSLLPKEKFELTNWINVNISCTAFAI